MLQPNDNIENRQSSKLIWIGIVVLVVAVIIGIVVVYEPKSNEEELVIVQNNQVVDKSTVSESEIYGTMTLRSVNTKHRVGDEIPVRILLDTQGTNITVARAFVEYDESVLEVVEIRKKNSVLDMSLFELIEDGYVFASRATTGDGIVNDSDDGFTGKNGELVTIVFRAIKTGPTKISLNMSKSGMNADNEIGTELILSTEPIDIFVQ